MFQKPPCKGLCKSKRFLEFSLFSGYGLRDGAPDVDVPGWDPVGEADGRGTGRALV